MCRARMAEAALREARPDRLPDAQPARREERDRPRAARAALGGWEDFRDDDAARRRDPDRRGRRVLRRRRPQDLHPADHPGVDAALGARQRAPPGSAGSPAGCTGSRSRRSRRSTAGRWPAGSELALACDIRIASERAQFGSFEARRGYHHGDGGIVRLVNTCGAGVALEMLLTAEPIDAERALRCNLVSRVVPHDELLAAAEQVAASDPAQLTGRGALGEGDDPRRGRPAARRPAAHRGAQRLLVRRPRGDAGPARRFYDRRQDARQRTVRTRPSRVLAASSAAARRSAPRPPRRARSPRPA